MKLEPTYKKITYSALMDVEMIVIIPYVLYVSRIAKGGTSMMYSLHITPLVNIGFVVPRRKK